MKSLFFRGALLLSLCTSAAVSAQESVLLKMSYSPDTAFRMTDHSDIEMMMDAAPVELERMPAEQRDQFPMNIKVKGETVTLIRAGSLSEDGSFPISMSVESAQSSMSMNDGYWTEQPAADDVLGDSIMEARVHPDGQVVVDSLNGEPVAPELEGFITAMFEQFTGAGLNDIEVALGQTVPVRVPMAIPMGEMGNIEVEIVMYYTLDAIKDGMGLFRIAMDMQMNMQVQDMTFALRADGTGMMEYDIAAEYSPKMDMDMTMNVGFPPEAGSMSMSMNMHNVIQLEPVKL